MPATGDVPDGGGGSTEPEIPPRRGYGRSDLPIPRKGRGFRLDLAGRVLVRVLAILLLVVALVAAIQWVAAGEVSSLSGVLGT